MDWSILEKLDRFARDDEEAMLIADRVISGRLKGTIQAIVRCRRRRRRWASIEEGGDPLVVDQLESHEFVRIEFSDLLSAEEQRLLVFRMECVPLRVIAKEMRCSHTEVRRRFSRIKRKLLQDGRFSDYRG